METENGSSRRELAKDPKRKAKSIDPGWKYAYWPTPDVNKDLVKCILCGNQNHGKINRFKQHLIGGYPDIVKCPKTNKDIAKEMNDFVQSKNAKKKSKQQHIVQEDSDDEVEEIPSTAASNTLQSSKSSVGKKGKAAPMPFNFMNLGQYGPGLKPPTYHELRVPLLKKAKDETEKLKEKPVLHGSRVERVRGTSTDT